MPALIIGANDEGRALAEQLSDWRTSGLFIKGVLDNEREPGSQDQNGYQILGSLDDAEELVRKHEIEEIIIAPTALKREQLLRIFRRFNNNPDINLRMSSGLFEIITTGMRVKELAYVPLIEVNPTRIEGVNIVLKMLMDYSLAIVLLILLSPVFIILGFLVWVGSPGPIFHRRHVMGLNGTKFDAFKFRTMLIDCDERIESNPELRAELEENYKIKDDPRVTRVGKFLRKYSLDELPQLFNVLMGQMSLIGPRMISPPELGKYSKWDMNLLTVKPGITGLWQVSGRSDTTYEERVQIDMYYIRNWTIWLDIFILLKTPLAILNNKGAY
jgi:exopolysaccharide biosynthesis polyprenyl glycosylphosphotransferase